MGVQPVIVDEAGRLLAAIVEGELVPNILVSPEELRSHANNVKTRAMTAQSDFNALRAQLEALSSAFQGQAATAFQTHYEQWHTSAVNLTTALESLGRFLDNSATTIEQTDQQLASGLG